MHSSRIHTTCSLSVSHSIRGGSALLPLEADPPDADPLEADPLDADPWRQTRFPECRAPVNRQTGIKTLPWPKLRLRAVKMLYSYLL